MKNSVAILIFTQEVSKDASRKILTPTKNFGLNKQLFTQLNHHINHVAYQTDLPVFRSAELISNTGTFGNQLTKAVQNVFEKGFEKVICVGNDCPALTHQTIIKAASILENKNSIVGPDNHGGVYLIGLTKENFDAQKFENLAWQSVEMLNSFLQNIDNQSFIIEKINDIHNYQELKNYFTKNYFVSYLLFLIEKTQLKLNSFYQIFLDFRLIFFHSLRGPPIF